MYTENEDPENLFTRDQTIGKMRLDKPSVDKDMHPRDTPVASIENGDQEDLISLGQILEMMRLDTNETIVGWKPIGQSSEQLLVRYGPPNAAKFVLKQPSKVMTILDRDIVPNFGDSNNRYGEKKHNQKFLYDYTYYVAIQGVAWKHNKAGSLFLLKPKEKGEKRHYPNVYIKVKWKIEGKFVKSWEVRSTIHRLFGAKIGDEAIYEAATYQEDRYEEWVDGKRDAKDRSPTPNTNNPKLKTQSLLIPERSQQEVSKEPPKQEIWNAEAYPSKQNIPGKKEFWQTKHEVAQAFLQELDSIITEGKLSEMTASTGGMKIIWNKRLVSTAGRANWRRERNTGDNSAAYHHHAFIELAEKIIDDEDRLLNTVAHEFCHLANFIISGIVKNPHGKEFKSWGKKCSQHFGNRGIHVTTKHSYDISYKYSWECTNCGAEYKRHSKTIDPLRHGCGLCKSKLVQTKPVSPNPT